MTVVQWGYHKRASRLKGVQHEREAVGAGEDHGIYKRLSRDYEQIGDSNSIANQENAPQTCPQASLMETFSQLRLLLFR